MSTFLHDLRFAFRTLLKQPSFALVAILTLALGIGATTTVFSVVHGVFLRPLPYGDPDRLVVIWETSPRIRLPHMYASPPNFADWRAAAPGLAGVAAFRLADFTLQLGGEPERIEGARVSASTFGVLGVSPAFGRAFREEEDAQGAPATVVLSHGLWQRRFGGSRDVIDRVITIDGVPHTVIGVMPAGFKFPPPVEIVDTRKPMRAELWTTHRINYAAGQRGAHYLSVIARLALGATAGQAQSGLRAVAARLAQEYPATNTSWDIALVPLHEEAFGRVSASLLILLGAVGFLLLIACANVANLLLARATSRRREISIRTALGAARVRLVRQLLTESALLSFAGCALGLGIAYAGARLVVAFGPQHFHRLDEVAIRPAVVLFTLGVAVLTTVLFGLIPALQASEAQLANALREGGRRTIGSRGRLRSSLVIVEVALAVVLLTGGGLLFRSFLRLQAVPLGFETSSAIAMTVNLPAATYTTREQRAQFFSEVERRLASLPQVRHLGYVDSLPLGAKRQGTSVWIEGTPEPRPGEDRPGVYFPYVQRAVASPMTLVLKTEGDPRSVIAPVRAEVSRLNSTLAVYDVRTIQQVVDTALAQPRLSAFLLVLFAGLSLLLAAVGIYGVLSYTVSQRVPELGVRIALGAQRSHILGLVLGGGMKLVFIGVFAGLAGSLALTRVLASQLFGVGASDPVTFALVAVLLAAVAAISCYVPARRAMRTDPVVSLRHE